LGSMKIMYYRKVISTNRLSRVKVPIFPVISYLEMKLLNSEGFPYSSLKMLKYIWENLATIHFITLDKGM
jgi:hypothetical protein